MFAGIFYGRGFGGVLRSVSHGREGPWPPSQVSRVLIVARDHCGKSVPLCPSAAGCVLAAHSGQLAKYRPIYVSCIARVHSQWPSAFWRWVCSSFKAICATHVLCDHICPPCYMPIPSNTHCLQTSPVYIQLSHI